MSLLELTDQHHHCYVASTVKNVFKIVNDFLLVNVVAKLLLQSCNVNVFEGLKTYIILF